MADRNDRMRRLEERLRRLAREERALAEREDLAGEVGDAELLFTLLTQRENIRVETDSARATLDELRGSAGAATGAAP